jgi:uncharacterized protein YqeY
MLEQRIEQDLKAAMLGGDKERVSALRNVKSVLLNVKVNTGKRETGLPDDEVIVLLSKEAKKRQESADLYVQGGDQGRADAELTEKKIIEAYLPSQLSEAEIADVIDAVMSENGLHDKADLGKIIGTVKEKTKGAADGSVIARLVKEKVGA